MKTITEVDAWYDAEVIIPIELWNRLMRSIIE